MKKALYYDIELEEFGKMYNNGFIIAEIEDGRVTNVEGVITCDFLKAEINKDNGITFEYYTLKYNVQPLEEEFEFYIKQEDLELPINMEVLTDDKRKIKLSTKRSIFESKTKEEYIRILEEFKQNNVFKKGRL